MVINIHVFIEKSFFNLLFAAPRAQELELEDHQSRLEQKLREKMAIDGEFKGTDPANPVLPLGAAQPAKCEVSSSGFWWRQLGWAAQFWAELEQQHCTCNYTD